MPPAIDVLCLGEALIDFVALETGVAVGDASGFLKAAGGAPANVAVGAARLGGSAGFLGKVGNDPFGQFLRRTLEREGVDTRGLREDPAARTGLAFVSLQADGERDFVFFRNPSADMLYRPEEVDSALVRGARALHFGSITLIQEPSRSATLEAVRIARDAGIIVSYDPNLRPPLWPDEETARRAIREALLLADVVKMSMEEVLFVTGRSAVHEEDLPGWEPALGAWFVDDARPRLSVITWGRRGCFFAAGDTGRVVPGLTVDTVDSTGAGDAFVSAMLLKLLELAAGPAELRELSIEALIPVFSYANAAGALATTRKGAIPALPTAEQVESLLRRNRDGTQETA